MGYDCTIYAVSFTASSVLAKERLDRFQAFRPEVTDRLGMGDCKRLVLGHELTSAIDAANAANSADASSYEAAWRNAAKSFIAENTARHGPETLFGIIGENYDEEDVLAIVHKMKSTGEGLRKTEPTPELPTPATDVELHYIRDTDTRISGFLVVIPDARIAGMPGPDLAKILATAWNSSRVPSERIRLLMLGVSQIEQYHPAGVAPVVHKPSRRERFVAFVVSILRRCK